MFFEVSLAGMPIGIEVSYSYVKDLCKDYINKDYENYTEREYQDYKKDAVSRTFDVCVTEEEILAENTDISVKKYPIFYLETLAILREISERMPLYNRMLVHGAAISYNGSGYLFMAPSGIGKTTHIRLWKQYLGEKVQIVNGDKPFLELNDNNVWVHGSPWAGKEGWNKNCSVSLKGMVFLRRGVQNKILKQDASECITPLTRQVYLPENQKAVEKTLELMDKMLKVIPAYMLECDMSEMAVQASFEMLTGQKYNEEKGKI